MTIKSSGTSLKAFRLAGSLRGYEKAATLNLLLLDYDVSMNDYRIVKGYAEEYSFYVKPKYLTQVTKLINGLTE